MLWNGKRLEDLSAYEFSEAVQQNARLSEAIDLQNTKSDVFKTWHKKALALTAEGKRRGLVPMNGDRVA